MAPIPGNKRVSAPKPKSKALVVATKKAQAKPRARKPVQVVYGSETLIDFATHFKKAGTGTPVNNLVQALRNPYSPNPALAYSKVAQFIATANCKVFYAINLAPSSYNYGGCVGTLVAASPNGRLFYLEGVELNKGLGVKAEMESRVMMAMQRGDYGVHYKFISPKKAEKSLKGFLSLMSMNNGADSDDEGEEDEKEEFRITCRGFKAVLCGEFEKSIPAELNLHTQGEEEDEDDETGDNEDEQMEISPAQPQDIEDFEAAHALVG